MKKIKIYLIIISSIWSVVSLGQSKEQTRKESLPKYLLRNQYYNDIRDLDRPDAPKNYTAYREKMYKAEKKRHHKHNSGTRSNSGGWSSNGPATFTNYSSIGRVNRIAFHPTDPDIIYAATAGGGLWYTPNHGTIWYPMSDHIPNMNLSGVVINPSNPDSIFIFTGDGDGCCGSAKNYDLRKFSSGVLMTTDHGATWQQTGLIFDEQDEIRAYNLYSDPTNFDVMYACASDSLYRSLDGGVTWSGMIEDIVFEVLFKPDDSNVLFAVGVDDFYKSTDGGDSWTITATIPQINGQSTRMTMATCQNDPNRIYLYTAPRHDSLNIHRGLFLSDDAGDTFTKVDSTSNLDGGRQGRYDLVTACSNLDSDDVLIGKVALYKSTDNGSSFSISTGIHVDHHQLNTNPLLPNRIYLATDGGIYYSDNFGDTNSWTYISDNTRITQYYKISVGQTNPELVVGGAQDNGTHLNDDANSQYTQIFFNDGMDNAIHPLDDDFIIVSSQFGDFEISFDGGSNVQHLIDQNDLPESVLNAWVTPVAMDPSNTDNIYLGYNPIYRSSDMGDNFFPIPDTIGGRRFLHVGTNNPGRLYASDCYDLGSGCEYHIHRSDDFGTTWQPIHLSLPDSILQRKKSGVTTNPDDSDEVWITIAGFDANNKVWRSMNGGTTWTNETGSLPNIPVNCIIFQDTNGSPSGAVYIGTDIGIYYKDDNLGDWVYFSNDLPAVEVADLEIQYGSQKLFAGTHGRGIWTSDLYSECPQEYILNSILIQPERDYFFQASDSIALYDYNIESFGSNMKLKAGNVILIQEGFVAKSDNDNLFKARLGPCGGGIEYKSDKGKNE